MGNLYAGGIVGCNVGADLSERGMLVGQSGVHPVRMEIALSQDSNQPVEIMVGTGSLPVTIDTNIGAALPNLYKGTPLITWTVGRTLTAVDPLNPSIRAGSALGFKIGGLWVPPSGYVVIASGLVNNAIQIWAEFMEYDSSL